MLRIGHSHIGAVLLLYLWAAIGAFGAVSLAYVEGPVPLVGIGVAMLLALWLTGRLPRWLERRGL